MRERFNMFAVLFHILCLLFIGTFSSCINIQDKSEEYVMMKQTGDQVFCFGLKKNDDSIHTIDFTDPASKKGLIALLAQVKLKGKGHNFTLEMSDSEKPLQFCIKNYTYGKLPSINSSQCPFCEISRGEKPQQEIAKNDTVVAFEKVPKRTPVNFLITPIQHIKDLNELDVQHNVEHQKIWIAMLKLAQQLARNGKLKGNSGIFSLRIHTGPNAFQSVPHLHMHVISPDNRW